MKTPTFDRLVRHLETYGADSILEAARHLPEDEQKKLEVLVKAKKREGKARGRSKK